MQFNKKIIAVLKTISSDVLINSIPFGIIQTDKSFNIIFANKYAQELLDLPAQANLKETSNLKDFRKFCIEAPSSKPQLLTFKDALGHETKISVEVYKEQPNLYIFHIKNTENTPEILNIVGKKENDLRQLLRKLIRDAFDKFFHNINELCTTKINEKTLDITNLDDLSDIIAKVNSILKDSSDIREALEESKKLNAFPSNIKPLLERNAANLQLSDIVFFAQKIYSKELLQRINRTSIKHPQAVLTDFETLNQSNPAVQSFLDNINGTEYLTPEKFIQILQTILNTEENPSLKKQLISTIKTIQRKKPSGFIVSVFKDSSTTENIKSGKQLVLFLAKPQGTRFTKNEEHYLSHIYTTLSHIPSKLQLEKYAYEDTLTKVPNRRTFFTKIENLINTQTPFILINIDLDHFKEKNDTYGHTFGDSVLKEVAWQLYKTTTNKNGDTKKLIAELSSNKKEFLRKISAAAAAQKAAKTNLSKQLDSLLKNSVHRVGGDEFYMLLTDFGSLEKIFARLLTPIEIQLPDTEGSSLQYLSIGAALFPRDGKKADDILAAADRAMYEAKKKGHFQSGTNASLYDSRVHDIEKWLWEDLKNDKIFLRYTPRVEVFKQAESTTHYVRCMVASPYRIHPDPEKGLTLIENKELMSLNNTELLAAINFRTLELAVKQIIAWKNQPEPEYMRIEITISAALLKLKDFNERIDLILAKLSRAQIVGNQAKNYISLGFDSISCVDFGLAEIQSKLEIIHNKYKILRTQIAQGDSTNFAPRDLFDGIKISKDFMNKFDHANKYSRRVLESSLLALLGFAADTNMQVFAEGITSEAQIEILKIISNKKGTKVLIEPISTKGPNNSEEKVSSVKELLGTGPLFLPGNYEPANSLPDPTNSKTVTSIIDLEEK